MRERLQPTLALIDQGLGLYRRNFLGFTLITAAWFVPMAILVGLGIALGSRLSEGQIALLVLGGAVVLFPLLIYLVGGLSRAAVAAAEGRPIALRQVMGFHPLRVLSMTCFTLVYGLLAQTVASVLVIVCICPLYLVAVLGLAGVASIGSSAVSIAGGLLVVLIGFGVYMLALAISGISYSSLVYGLQPWAQERESFGVSIQRSLEMTFYRFWRNLVVWGLTALVIAAGGLTIALTIGVLVPLPLILLLGEDSPIAQAAAASAWLIGFIFVLPPLPIWMALLYRRNRAARDGADLAERVQEWRNEHFEAVQHAG